MFRRRLLMQQAMSVPDPIAKYDPTGHTNEDMAEYPVLTDLTGNGHDISCNNFAWGGMSGIGGYATNFLDWNDSSGTVDIINPYILKITKQNGISSNTFISVSRVGRTFKSILRISGIPDDRNSLYIKFYGGQNVEGDGIYLGNGTHEVDLNASDDATGLYFHIPPSYYGEGVELDITIEQFPLYGNALVSDGVDDYGICENLPILTKEKGYTVVAVRKWITQDYQGAVVSKNTVRTQTGAFLFEGKTMSNRFIGSFGNFKTVNNFIDSLFTYQTSTKYGSDVEFTLTSYKVDETNLLAIFSYYNNSYANNCRCSIALYSLEIYDRDLTPYQIEAVKKRLMDKYNNPEDTTSDWYGVEWYTNQSPSRVMRIGSMNMHRSLPIQSGMYRCILNDNGEEVYRLDPNDSTKKEDGTPAVLDGTDGQVMVYIPVFYTRFEFKGYRRRVKLSDHYKPGFMRMGGCYISAYEATIDRTTSGTPKLASVVNETANFRGGTNNAEWDGSYRSLLGMPATATSLTNFRTYARNRKAGNTEWNCMDYHAYKALYWLYVVEYANRNCQLDFNDALTSEGFRQGGLGAGVTNINGTKWNTFNGCYPFIKCGYTNSLGNKTGIVAYTMPDEYDAETPLTTYVPSYRGVENPFGHIWKWTDGLHIRIQSEEAGGRSILYTSDNPASYQDSNYDGYDEIGDVARSGGYVKDILFDEGEILPTITTGSSSTKDFSDYFYTNIPASGESLRGVLFGGHASAGANAGFACSFTNSVPTVPSEFFGSRLCFIPNNQLVTT